MPVKDQYNEIFIAIIAGIIVFLVITGMVVFILLFYQKKKFQHRQQLTDMQHRFSEELFKSQLEIQEHTFNQISSEIHDNVGQILSLAKVQVNMLLQQTPGDKEMLYGIRDNIGKSISDLRNIAKSLNSDLVNTQSVHAAVEEEAARIHKTGILQVSVLVEGEEATLQNQKKLILYRIVQESLQNVLKHAAANRVDIVFTYAASTLQIVIADDGAGFDVPRAMQYKSGLGLFNIEKRSQVAGGSCSIESWPGKGTRIAITVPYD